MCHKTEAIKIFFNAFRKLQKFIDDYCRDQFEFEGLILSCCYLDSLAGYKYGGESNGDRFNKFVNEYSGRREIYTKIALPILLQEIPNLKIDSRLAIRLQQFLTQEIGVKINNYVQYGYDIDIDLVSLWERLKNKFSPAEIELLGNKIEKFQYSYLLWRNYRNPLIHETAIRDEAPNLARKEEPYYHTRLIQGGGNRKVHFGIPRKFVFETLKDCISNFEKECLEKQWDPVLDKK